MADAATLVPLVEHLAKTRMAGFDCSHDWLHVERVRGTAMRLLQEERKLSDRSLDRLLVEVAALMHDVNDHKYHQGDESISEILQSLGAAKDFAERVAFIVRHVSYSNEKRMPPEAMHLAIEECPELAIVQDADRLDAIGAVGVARCFAFAGARGPNSSFLDAVEHFHEKLEHLGELMKTQTGKQLAKDRTARLVQFREWFQQEVTEPFFAVQV